MEEMLCCEVDRGALFYGEPRRREVVSFSAELRADLESATESMHTLFARKHTPKPKKGKYCSSCSMKDLCLPKVGDKPESVVRKYLEDSIE